MVGWVSWVLPATCSCCYHSCTTLVGAAGHALPFHTANAYVLPVRLQVGFTREGRLVALDLNLYCNAGNSLDLRQGAKD